MSDKIRLVILSESQLLPREVEFFCMDEMAEQFQLEYWDCSAFLFPPFRVPEKVIEKDYLKIIPSLSAFADAISSLPSDTVVVEDVFANKANYRFHTILNKYFHSYLTVFFATNSMSMWQADTDNANRFTAPQPKSWIQKIKEIIYRPFFVKRLVTYLRHHNSPEYEAKVNRLYDAQTHRMSDITIIGCNSQFEWRINHPDYERYLRLQAPKESPVKEPYIVFVDEYFPYLQEVKMDNPDINLDETARMYYQSMNAFFDVVEKQYKCPVVVAAHPRADYSKYNPYGGREIFFYRTVELIKFCRACIIHNSNCYSFVVLYNKPVAAVINDALHRSMLFTNYIIDVNANLRVEVQDIDNPNKRADKDIFAYIDESVRKRYIQTYLHDNGTSKNNAELLAQYFREFHERVSKK